MPGAAVGGVAVCLKDGIKIRRSNGRGFPVSFYIYCPWIVMPFLHRVGHCWQHSGLEPRRTKCFAQQHSLSPGPGIEPTVLTTKPRFFIRNKDDRM